MIIYGIVAVTGRAHCQRQVAFFNTVGKCLGQVKVKELKPGEHRRTNG